MARRLPSKVAPIRSLLLKHPRQAWADPENIGRQWRALGYRRAEPDLGRASEEYDAFVELLRRFVPEIHFLPTDDRTGLDSIYV